MTPYKVGYLIGSLSSKSINQMLSRALVRLAPPELEMTEIPFDRDEGVGRFLYSGVGDGLDSDIARAIHQGRSHCATILALS